MGQVMHMMGWVSFAVCLAILGMGGAPIAEKFGIDWLVTALTGIAYIANAFLAISSLLIGGLFLYHGALTLMGKSPGQIMQEDAERLAKMPPAEVVVVEQSNSST